MKPSKPGWYFVRRKGYNNGEWYAEEFSWAYKHTTPDIQPVSGPFTTEEFDEIKLAGPATVVL